MKYLLVFIISFIITNNVSATNQAGDRLIYQGKEYPSSTYLESYFDKNPGKRPIRGLVSTALWRGYIATYEIKDNELYVKEINIEVFNTATADSYDTKWIDVVAEVFPDTNERKATWMSELLVLRHRELTNDGEIDYESIPKNYTLLVFENGKLKKEMQMKRDAYEKYHEKQFQLYKTTEKYEIFKSNFQKGENKYSDSEIDDIAREFDNDYESKPLPD